MNESRALLVQVNSDMKSARTLVDPGDQSLNCHVLAKYQQAVEKSIKAVVATMRERRLLVSGVVRRGHYPQKQIEVLLGLKLSIDFGIPKAISALLSKQQLRQIKDLCSLALSLPRLGALHAQNTEYPYEVSMDDWRAPAERNAFAKEEVEHHAKTAKLVVLYAVQAVEVINSAPSPKQA